MEALLRQIVSRVLGGLLVCWLLALLWVVCVRVCACVCACACVLQVRGCARAVCGWLWVGVHSEKTESARNLHCMAFAFEYFLVYDFYFN